ncbi:hypothetical protein P170DRAFT_431288 [Aspergillus steynii IBT 23096]|uniref:Uncharacterized protein n=1 Tax=Aspergillus steynii IBT 23096 TaxID=1392250 RepID=A0A2I2FRU8_9EURO|nr:uncharacterized protein P170DRAFT_431288 [Aspergillus steynii IBT 23096]PLB43339.1 hypothetical protein P170DRAFT_431288 [Aspergillus steynii IBT 23096]
MLITQILRLHVSVGKARLAALPSADLMVSFEFNKYGSHKVVRLRGRAESHTHLFANKTHPYDDVERIIAHARKSPRKYRQFLKGIDSIRVSHWVKSQPHIRMGLAPETKQSGTTGCYTRNPRAMNEPERNSPGSFQ